MRESARTTAKSRTNLSTNSGKATKWLGRLAPNLAHMCKFIWEWIYAEQIAPRDTRVFRGSTIQKYWEAVRLAPTLVHVCGFIWEWTYRLNTSRPSIPRGHWGGGGRGSHIQKSGKAVKRRTGWHRIWYTTADSSGNGHRLNTIRPTIPQGHFGFY